MAVVFQLGIDNTSPTITYDPFSPNTIALNATAGWTPYYTNSGFPLTLGRVENGTSLQISSKNGSFLSVTWFGTGIDLYGNATGATFEVSLDRKTGGESSGSVLVNPGSNLLASFSNLQLDTYTVTLTAQISSSLPSFIAFDRAVVTSAVGVTNLDNVTIHSEMVDDASIAYRGWWSFQELTAPSGYFHMTNQSGDSAQLTFNGTAVSVFGLRDPTAGYYNITLDGETTQYNAQSAWKEGAVLFYMTGLDPERPHSLTITNADNNLLAVGYINTTFVSGVPISTSSTSISKGTIVGIVMGIILGGIVLPILGFVLWRCRRRKGNARDFTFIEPSVHKGFDITESLDIPPGVLGQRGKSPTQSPVSDLSLDLFPVTLPQITTVQSKLSPLSFPRSPATPSPSPIPRLLDNSDGDVVHSPDAVYQFPSVHIRNPLQVDSENTPLPGVIRRSTVPKPSGPRPPSYRRSNDDPRTSVFMPPGQILTDPTPTKAEEPPEPEMEQVNEGAGTAIYSFLDMNSSSGPPSTTDSIGQSHDLTQPAPQMNFDPPRLSLVTRSNSTRSHHDSDKRRESRSSKPLSLSVVIQQPPTLKYPPSADPHPYAPYSARYRLTPQFYRPRTGEGASPTESIPITTSEISEIRFCNPGDSNEPSGSSQKSDSDTQLPPPKTTTAVSPIYKKLFGTLSQGDIPQGGLLAKKRSLHRKALSAPMFNTPPRT